MIVTPGPRCSSDPVVLVVAYGVAKNAAVQAVIRGGRSMAWSPTRVSPALCLAEAG